MPRSKHSEPKVRLNLDISQSLRERVELLQHTIDADSMTEVIRRSVALTEELVNATKRGDAVVIRDGTTGLEKTIILV